MKLHHLNRMEGLTVEQFAIEREDDDAIEGGFTLFTNPKDPTWSMGGGLHVNKPCPKCGHCEGVPYEGNPVTGLVWIWAELRKLYPELESFYMYRSTGLKRGLVRLKMKYAEGVTRWHKKKNHRAAV